MSCLAEFGADAALRKCWALSAKASSQLLQVSYRRSEQDIEWKKPEEYVGKLAVFNARVKSEKTAWYPVHGFHNIS